MSGRRMTRLRALSQQLETLQDSNTVSNCSIASEVSLTQGEQSGSARTNGFDRESAADRRPTRLRSRASSSRQNSGIQRNHRTLRSNAAGTSNARVIGVATLNPIEEGLQTNGDETFVGVAWGEEPIPMAISDNDEEQNAESVMEISSNSSVEEVEAATEILPNAIQADVTNDLTQLRDLPSPTVGRPNVDRLLPQAPSLVENSQADFQLPSHSSVKKKSPDKKLDETVDESEFCTICYEQWTTAGKHRLVCLKCGHLFGKECIEKWLDSQMKSTCPQCNAKASKKDIRCIYVRKLMAVDNTEVERLKKELEEERVARRRMELDLGLMVFKWQQTEDNCNVLKKELAAQRELTQATVRQAAMDSFTQDPSHGKSGRYEIEKTFTIDVGGCRALAYNSAKMYLCASQASSSPLYPGFGVRKLSTVDLKTFQYVPMHSKQIRDLSFHPTLDTSLLLSCAVDKTVKITSMDSLEVVQSFTCSSPVWSCTWSQDNLKHFFIGTQSGEVLLFDIRDTREHVASLLPQAHNPKSIVSLRYVPRFISSSPGPGGLLVGQLDRSLFLEQNNNDNTFVTHFLSNDSVLMSLCREETTGHVLASYRPTQQNPIVRHEVNNLVLTQKPPGSVTPFLPSSSSSSSYYERVAYDRVRTFNGGTSQQTLTRTALIPHPELGAEQLFVCAGDGNNAALNIWNVSTGYHHQRLVGPDQGVTDVCTISCEEGASRFLSAVGNKHVFIYRWKAL